LKPFDQLVRQQSMSPMVTNEFHMQGTLQGSVQLASLTRELPSERAPDGNAVSVESELTKVAQNETNAGLVGNLWKTYMGMYMTALGH
jgi:flagellar basal-body rod protein FlgB